MMRCCLLLLALFLSVSVASAQQKDWQYYYEQLVDGMQEDADEEQAEQIAEVLSAVASVPLNINAITREELEGLLFLNNNQIEAVLEYVGRYGPMMSKAEIMMIPYLDDTCRGLLSCLTYVGKMPPRERTFLDTLRYDESFREYKKYYAQQQEKGEITTSLKVPFYSRKGDETAYFGEKYKHWTRLKYNARNITVGFVASQDAGEPFFANRNKWGYDYYSAFVQVKRWGKVRNLVAGHYRLRTGLGLVLNNNLSFGKTLGMASIRSQSTVLRPHSSRFEANYMQGAAATVALSRRLETTLFASYRPIDATFDEDGMIRTIVKTGYHRTESELNRKHNAWQTTAGANLRYSLERLNFGVTGVYNRYNIPMKPWKIGAGASQLYRRFYPSGRDFWNISVDYGYKLGKRFRLEGETATGDCGQIATVNTLTWRASNRLSLYSIYRYYPIRFYATMGNSFSEGGGNQNEHGLYAGLTWTPSPRFTLTGYADMAYFQWPKYQATGSSSSFDNFLQATYKLSPSSSLTARYRLKMREKDAGKAGLLAFRKEHRQRLAFTTGDSRWSFRSQLDMTYCDFMEKSFGFMLGQTVKYSMKPWKIAAGASWFNTKDYNSRVYVYEQSTPYNFHFPSFFGKGLRLYSVAEAVVKERLSVIAKLGFTHYFDRDKIGSSYQQIDSSSQTDLEIMLRWRMK